VSPRPVTGIAITFRGMLQVAFSYPFLVVEKVEVLFHVVLGRGIVERLFVAWYYLIFLYSRTALIDYSIHRCPRSMSK
jgi:hypothetical protein